MLMNPCCAGQPRHSPATGKTLSGSSRISATSAIRLRSTLIGQVPSPCRLGGQDAGLQSQRRVHGRVEKPFERAVLSRFAAQLTKTFEPPGVAEKHEKHRRGADPRHVGKQRSEAVAPIAVLQPQRRRLLEIRFRRSRKRRGQQQPHQRIGHGAGRYSGAACAASAPDAATDCPAPRRRGRRPGRTGRGVRLRSRSSSRSFFLRFRCRGEPAIATQRIQSQSLR